MTLAPVDIHFESRRPWKTLANLYRPERAALGPALLFFLVKTTPVWVLPVVTANIVDVLARPEAAAPRRLAMNAGVGLLCILQNVLTNAYYVRGLSSALRNVEVRIRSALVRRLQMLSLGFLGQRDIAALQTKLLRDVESVEQMSRQLFDIGVAAATSVVVALAVTAVRAPVFVPVFLTFAPLVGLGHRLLTRRIQPRHERLRLELEAMNSSVLGMLAMIPVTRAHAVEHEEVSRAEERFASVRSAAYSLDSAMGTFGGAVWATLMTVNFGGLSLAAWLAYRGTIHLTAGDFVLVAGYFATIMAAVLQLNALLPVVTRGCDGLESIGEVLESPDIEENRGKRPVGEIAGAFTFDAVTYHYPGNAGSPPALDGVSFQVGPGETVAIVGPSGSGKSTFASLVTGFHRPTGGRILLDGADLTTIDLRTYRRQMSVVTQQTILFHGTLRENVVYGARNVTEDSLRAALDAANVSEFLRDLPAGIDTLIGPAGIQLSGGQRQRLAIARAILRRPKILILDEATSALDLGSEAIVQEALERLAVGRTTFVIAHRLSVLRRVDRVVVFDKGRLVESGPRDELLANANGYLARLQAIRN